MTFLQHIFEFFRKKPEIKPEKVDEAETCAFCWGYQEYDHKSRILSKDKQIDVKNHRDKHVKVGKFMVEHVDGFKNQKRVIERCPKCCGKRIKFKDNL